MNGYEDFERTNGVTLIERVRKRVAVGSRMNKRTGPRLLRSLIKLEQLGGYLVSADDLPPGNIVKWRVMRRLIDIQLANEFALENWGFVQAP